MIELINGYVVDVDAMQYTLKQRRQNKKGEEVLDTISYHGTLASAIKNCVHIMSKDKLSDGVYTLSEALEVIKEQNVILEGLLGNEVKHG